MSVPPSDWAEMAPAKHIANRGVRPPETTRISRSESSASISGRFSILVRICGLDASGPPRPASRTSNRRSTLTRRLPLIWCAFRRVAHRNGIPRCRNSTGQVRFGSDSPLERARFEPSVPGDTTEVSKNRLMSPLPGFPPTKNSRREREPRPARTPGIFRGTERCYGAGGEEWQLRRCI